MGELFLEKFWGKYISLLIMPLVLGIIAIPFIPREEEGYIGIVVYGIIAIILYIIYFCYVICINRLPCCKSSEVGVLFIFKVASEKQYQDFKYLIENNFKDSLKNKAVKIRPICLKADNLKNYDRNDIPYMTNILRQTNCYFCVEFFVESDSLDNPTEYLTTLNLGVLHPNVSKKSSDFLMKNLSFGSNPIRKLKFNSKDKVNILKAASKHLELLSEYILGVLLIMCKQLDYSISVLTNLYDKTNENHAIYKMICEALYEAYFHKAVDYFNEYRKDYNKSYLDKLEYYLRLSNEVLPNQYGYHANMAVLMFLKYRDINSAKEHINCCKIIGKDEYWKYSEAFLIAYECDNPNIVYGKYKSLKNINYNIIDITWFIEAILINEPQKIILHLALGVLYDINGNSELASCHFKQFVDSYSGEIQLRKNSLKTIKRKINKSVCVENRKLNLCENCAGCR